MPLNTASAASWLEALPMRPPSTSEEEQPTTRMCPGPSPASASSSSAACRAWAVIRESSASMARPHSPYSAEYFFSR